MDDFVENSDGDLVISLVGFLGEGMLALKGVTTECGTPRSLVLKFKSIISVFAFGDGDALVFSRLGSVFTERF